MKSIGYTAIFCLSFALSPSLFAQKKAPIGLIQDMLRQSTHNMAGETFTEDQIVITDQYQTDHNQLLHLYFQQQHQAIPIFGTVSAIHLNPTLEVQHESNRFVYGAKDKIVPTPNLISPEKALLQVLLELGIPLSPFDVNQKPDAGTYEIWAPELSKSSIQIKRLWYPIPISNLIVPAWEIGLSPVHSADYWHYYIDGRNGQVLHKWNETLYCTTPHSDATSPNVPLAETPWLRLALPKQMTTNDNASYRVFPFPVESPIHGEQASLTTHLMLLLLHLVGMIVEDHHQSFIPLPEETMCMLI